jgi:hypothetical protein
MIASMLACGACFEETEAILGAKVEVKRFEIRRGCHVTAMESGKLLYGVSKVEGAARSNTRVFYDENVIC